MLPLSTSGIYASGCFNEGDDGLRPGVWASSFLLAGKTLQNNTEILVAELFNFQDLSAYV